MVTHKDSAELGSAEIEEIPVIDKRAALAAWLGESANEGHVVRTRLKTSDRVIARVTDGIYRQPASALRELISNAWDADANNVTILTDAPRFARIYIRDDGAGMSYETLSRLLHNIGGSAKRREEGQKLGVTSADDSEKTPGGRLIIGKIGIGLFSVSQLARRFRIITKVKGENYRLIAEVRVRAYSEDGEDDAVRDDDDNFVSGDVLITREYSPDTNAHGTDIVLDDVKPRVRDMLRSADRWRALDEKKQAEEAGDLEAAIAIRVEAPLYHSGWIEKLSPNNSTPAVLTHKPNYPWTSDSSPDVRMAQLMDAIEKESSRTERPDLETTLDTYLETLWTLALSVPVEYVDKHPFDLTSDSGIGLYWISNETRGQAVELDLKEGQTVRDAVKEQVPGHPELQEGKNAPIGNFKVTIDGIELKRPIRFKYINANPRSYTKPMLFVGRYSPLLKSVDPALKGGEFGLEGYLFWNGKVVPKENNGVLIRIRGTSGGVFDSTFFKYQVSELTRLRQITTELFITKGLDAALNIDRESFNFSHPHVQFVAMWLHRSIRQLTNKHKDLSKRVRVEKQGATAAAIRDAITVHSEAVWQSKQSSDLMPEVTIAENRTEAETARSQGYMAVVRADVPTLKSTMVQKDREDMEVKARALMRVLAAYEVLDDRPYDEQQALIEAILKVFISVPVK